MDDGVICHGEGSASPGGNMGVCEYQSGWVGQQCFLVPVSWLISKLVSSELLRDHLKSIFVSS